MKLTFFCVAPPKSRMVSPLVSRIWVKNSSNPRLRRTERVAAPALPFSFLPPGGAGGPPPACPPRDPRKNPLSGSSMTKNAFNLTLHLCDAWRPRSIYHGGLRRRNGRLRLGRPRHLNGLRLHDVDTPLEIRAILDDDARRADIPGQLGILADLNLLRGLHVSLNI